VVITGVLAAAEVSDHATPVDRHYIVTDNWLQATVVAKTHKLGVWIDPGPGYAHDFGNEFPDVLFDRRDDPLETRNLIGQPQYSEIERTLRS